MSTLHSETTLRRSLGAAIISGVAAFCGSRLSDYVESEMINGDDVAAMLDGLTTIASLMTLGALVMVGINLLATGRGPRP